MFASLTTYRYWSNKSEVRFPGRSNRTVSPTLHRRCDVSSGLCYPGAGVAEMDPGTRYTLRRNTESMMKICFFLSAFLQPVHTSVILYFIYVCFYAFIFLCTLCF